MAVDDVWLAFKRACKALVEAKNQKERGPAIEGVQAFLSDDLHRAYVHKWRGWGLLFSNLLHIVKVDVQGYLGIVSAVQGSTPTKKRKVKAAGNSGKNATSTFLRYWHYLRNEFAAAHAVDGPMLHLDANGRECVKQLMQFCLAVINRDTERELDPYLSTSIETEAWQTIELIVQFRVYCAVLTKDEMRDVLELTLAAIDRDSAPLSAAQLVTRASVCHLAIKNCPYDIHDWLPRLSSFFGEWFTDLDPEEDSSLAVIAPKLVEVLTELCKLYFPTIGRVFLPKHGLQVLRAQQRSVQVPKTRNDQRVLSLWSLRVVLMLKKESGLKVVSNHVLELDFPPDFLLAVASTLCGIPGTDSLQILVKLIEEAATEISRGNRKRVGNSASGLLFASDVVFVLHHCATMHEGRKRSQREEVPELLLRCARASVDRVTSDPYKASLRIARRIEVQALEAFFRLDPDLFGDFIEVIMLALDDVDTTVRITSTQSMPSIFYMFPDGRAQAFRDLFQIMLPVHERKQHLEPASGDDKSQANDHSEWMEYCMPVLSALYVCACSDPLVVPEVLAHFTSLANGTFSTLFTRPTILHPWLSEIARWYGYPSVSRLLDDHFCFLWSKYIATQAGGLSDSEEERKHLIASGPLRATTLLDGFPGSILLQEGQHAVASLFRRNMDVILPLAVLYDAVAGGSSGQFPLVDDLMPVFFSSNDPNVPGISLATEEQLITDLFALAFVLQSTANTTYHDAANCILMVAEDKASTHALSISHLGHVVLKMARFSIWDIVCDQESNDPDIWQRAMKSMKDKYSGYDWSQMNLAELLSGYHEIILRCSSSGPISARAVDCFCLFVDEIHNAVRDSFVLQRLMLHVSFQAIRVTTSRLSTKSSTRKLTRLVRKTCEAFMRSEDKFGKYVNSVVQEIAQFLVAAEDVSASAVRSSSSASRTFWLEADDRADLEWVIFAICNNLAGGLGKHIADIDMVETRGSSCLEKLNSLITTGRRKEDSRDATDSAALLSSKYRQARQEINQFAQRSDRIDEKFYRSSMVLTRSTTHSQPNAVNPTTESTQFLLLQESIRNLHGKLILSNDDPSTQEAIGKLIRYLFDMSTRSIHDVSSNQSVFSDSVADLLGEVGAWDPQVVELSLGHNVEELSRLYGRRFRRGALFETKVTFRAQMYESLLFYLASLLFDSGVSNSDVIYEAVRTLKNVLSLEKGINSLSKCKDTELKQFIEPFVNESPSNWSLSPLAISQAPTGSITSKSQLRRVLSLSEATSYDQWICTATSALTSYCDDEVLRSCSKLVTHRADLAAFLFPFAIQCIFRSEKADRELTTIVTKSVREILSGMQAGQEESNSQQVTVDEPAVQLLIHTLNFVRETEKSFFVESNGRTAVATPVKKSSESGQKTSSAPLNRVAYSCIIDVDLLEVAAAAIRVKMPYSAMQYVEMWLESQLGGVISSLALLSSSLTTPNHVLKAEEKVRSLLVEAYSFDNDVDGLYGVNDGRRVVSQLVTHNQERSYNKTLPLYDVSLQFQHSDLNHQQLVEGMFNALNRLGYHHMLGGYLQAMGAQQSQTPQLDEYQYELAWKGLQWGQVGNQLHTSSSVASFKVNHATKVYKHNRAMYQSLKALAYGDYQHVLKTTAVSKASILASVRLSLLGNECTTDSLTALLQLQSVHQVEAAARLIDQHTKMISSGMINAASDGNHMLASLSALFESWSEKRKQVSNQFDMAETLISLEEVLAEVTNVPDRHRILAKLYLSSSTLSRKADRIAVAYKAQMKLQKLSDQRLLTLHDEIEWKLEKAKLLWQQHETRSAIWTAKQVSNEIAKYCEEAARSGDVQLRMLHVAALTVTGRWMASQRSENSQVILGDYLQKATEIVDSMKSEEVAGSLQHATKAHFALAHYMAEMYNQVHSRVTSREWIAGKRVAEARQNELMMLVQMDEQQQMASRAHIHALNKEVGYDAEERARVEASVDEFLSGALRSYGKGLALSPRSELAVVFRVLSLWFANQLKPVVNGVLQEIIDIVPSYKFVPLSYQLMSRIGSTSTTSSTNASNLFELVLSRMVLKLCEEHPHHALVQLIALKNSGDVEGKGALEFRTNVGDAKSESARKYLDKLRKGQQRELLESLDVLSNAYVQLALFDTRDFHKQTKKIPLSKAPIIALSGHSVSFDQCLRDRSRRGANRTVMPPVLTASIAPRSDMDYSSVVRVSSFDTNFSITDSGIHRPKIIYCYGSDGQRFKQLVKGKDDTRQDLVIEQVFETVNHFLKEDDETLKRKLRLCTYKVVPLSPIAGVLEWVDKTMPWGAYLVGRSGKRLSAHERYHPHEWKHADCRMYLKNAPNKFDAYQQIEAHFTPVFHHFFLEKYPDPAMWYQRRLAYVQSAAVTSIVGYILGIGDRHSQNILIHEETAELVHIDFGVVFDQGMALFTPETVPFRLTRDLVDGMGVSGVDGVFTRCCEATLQLLRKKSASVVTILEVVMHDPLYRWTLSPLKALRIQKDGHDGAESRKHSRTDDLSDESTSTESNMTTGGNDAAMRALIRVKQKLEGYEDPNGNALSIEGQVKQLISVAQDQHNLCALFPGWAPWL
ncbi:hypothetical protein Poli38472_000189 [Pythium oligandrum]|uniref:non-specific serine/threonine protein kinase n=1 Tax=Pythium oligandrum TaxID=41045 RepID=A0A8K1CD71_PYTOL|nr:hypothetical protein Poli38472_000189 [Pythium oligandrum]|eukprot:TMW60147.1 hypothetical protein Poli38472_000189 [Pythium oligandrum]